MIHVITGLPGSFKTTWTLRELCGPGFAGRRIFAHGVNGLKIDSIESLDESRVRAWETLPAGAVIVVDEAQKLFPIRGMHSKPPEWIERLAEHRHGGYDFLLITQHPTFIDSFVRKLAGRHTHLARRFGMERATVFNWEEVKSPESETDKSFSVKSVFKPEAADYARHESATVHTHKRRLPWKKLLFAAACLLVVVAAAVFVYRHLTSGVGVVSSRAGASSGAPGGISSAPGADGGRIWVPGRRSARGSFSSRPESAPLYDGLQVVKSQPRVSGCISLGVSLGGKPACYCTTDQGTIINEISVHACRELLRGGWWDETKKPVDTGAEQRARLSASESAVKGKSGVPESGAPQGPDPAPPVLSAPTDGA